MNEAMQELCEMSKGPEFMLRLADLESRFAHTEKILQDLSDVTHQQWTQIDRLENKIKQLKERTAELEEKQSDAGELSEERPPHY